MARIDRRLRPRAGARTARPDGEYPTDEELSRQSVKPNMCVEVGALELHELSSIFDVDGAPIGVPAVQHSNGAAAPIRFVRGERNVRLVKPVDEYGGTLA